MSRLGGVVKIGKRVCERDDTGTIADYLEQIQKEGKIIFSLSGNLDKRHGLAIKKELKQRGRSVRFVEANNTATILHNNLVAFQTDLTVVNHTVFATAAIQPIEAFVERDYGRPKSDTKSGMLPPKLSRILIHLSGIQPNQTMWDPFCGSGTILMEAAAMGFTHLLGSDNSQKAIDDAQKNMEWIVENEKKKKSFQLFVSDVRTAERFLKQGTVDAIISEPYLGKPLRGHEPRSFLEKQAEKLRQLYVAAFKTFFPVFFSFCIASRIFSIALFRINDGASSLKVRAKKLAPGNSSEREEG